MNIRPVDPAFAAACVITIKSVDRLRAQREDRAAVVRKSPARERSGDVTRHILGDPAPGRTPWAAP